MLASPTARRAALAAGLIVTLGACRDPVEIPDPDAVAIVTVTPAAATLVPGQDLQLAGVARDRSRNPLPEEDLFWSSSDPSRATVSAAGLVSAISPGEVMITASAASTEGIAATVRLAIDEGAVIGPAGGTVSAFGGGLTLEVPENALAAPVAVRVGRLETSPLDATSAGGEYALRFEATLSVPATLTIAYLPEDAPAGVPESGLGLRLLTGGAWHPVLDSGADPASDRAIAHISSPGVYGVGRLPSVALCVSPEYRQFDFWLGRWGVAPTGSPPGTRQAASAITIEPGGCAVLEDFQDLAVHGVSISLYDAVTERWYQTFVDNTGTRLVLVGGLLGDAMVLTEADNASRITWSVTDPDVRQLGESSDDAGASWAPTFDLTYLRR